MLLQVIVGTKPLRARLERSGIMHRIRNRCLFVAMTVAVWWLVFVYRFVSDGSSAGQSSEEDLQLGNVPFFKREQTDTLKSSYHVVPEKFTSRDALSSQVEEGIGVDECAGKYVYMQEIPTDFCEALLKNCTNATTWPTMCEDVKNIGFGQPMVDPEGVFSETGWYATNQFTLEIIFHHRVKQYKCRTMDPSKASVVFVPFYTGMEVMPHLWDGSNITHRDEGPYKFAKWLISTPEWKRLHGHDHFMIAGRVTWDFRRTTDQQRDWGNKLLFLKPMQNITTLTIEASPYHGNDVAIPYPTYFHPTTDEEVLQWQDRVANLERKSLFCFAGAPRPEQDTSIRAQIMKHCKESAHCELMECTKMGGKCKSPANVIKLFKESHFCVQPSGDSYTRRSLFDSILSGCIPVFFHEYSAYSQYGWFLPAQNLSYSVFIDEESVRNGSVSIEVTLLRYTLADIEAMRKVVISLIPRIVYSNPENNSMTSKDAFERSMDGILQRVQNYRRSLENRAKSIALRRDTSRGGIREARSRLEQLLKGGIRPR